MGHFTYFPTGQFFVSYFALRCTSWFRCFSWLVGGYCGSLQPRLMLLLLIDRQSSCFSTNAFFGKISSIQPRFISIKLNLFVFVLRIYSIQAFFFLSCFFVNHSFAIIYFHLSYFLRVHFFYSTKKKTDGQIRFGNRKRPHKPLLLLLLPPRRATVLLYYCWLFGSIYTFFFFCIYSSFLQFLLISCCCFSPLDFT